MTLRTCSTIVLAAGEGTRMRSSRPKVLHPIAGEPLIRHVLTAVSTAAAGSDVAVVIGPGADAVGKAVRACLPEAEIFVQAERRGTGHAVLAARPALERGAQDILIAYGDTPLISPQTLSGLRASLAAGAAVVVLGFRPPDPTGYGRLLTEGDQLLGIREEKDATEAERAITLCNAGLMGLSGDVALEILDAITDENAKREFYLTDAVAIARSRGLMTVAREIADSSEVLGVNTQAELAQTEAIMQQRLRKAALDAGVTMVAPETVFLCADTRLGRDVVIEPFVVFGPGVTVEEGATIRSFCHFEQAVIRRGAIVGPYSRLRPGADIGPDAHIGNFVEVKAATVEAGAKANHLSYIGNARVGERANVGAGTITCNYDGIGKYHTDIGNGAFIGSNSSLVAPVKIGDGAYVGSGSVITEEVPAGGLAVGRGRQTVKEGWVKRWRERVKAAKK
ncbi:MAG: bifunctional UDP-N-acetylglucosamine diphosphorylase/glucosamine-1-phosphate N-acetyltransferase GlmU [Xanthobacteraceae bacterium]